MQNQWHYKCNGKIFYNKFTAIKESSKTKQHIYFHEPDNYKTVDWASSVSHVDWQILLKQRATEIRDTHKTVKFFLSGGCDSNAILKTFIDNKIPLDEIIMVKCGIPDADTEIVQATKFLKQLDTKKSKITVIQPKIEEYNNFYKKQNWYDYANYENNPLWFRLLHKPFYEHLDKQNEHTANVFGHLKPRLMYKNKEWWIQTIDVDQMFWTKQNTTVVPFYSGSTDVMKKQCHMTVDYIQNHFPESQYNTFFNKTPKMQQHMNLACGRIQTFEEEFIPKQVTDREIILGNINYFAYNQKEEQSIRWAYKNIPDALYDWKKSVDEYAKIDNGKWFNKSRPEFGFVGSFGSFYSITSNTVKSVDELFPNGYG